VTLALRPRRALLNGINPHVINLYEWIARGLVIDEPLENAIDSRPPIVPSAVRRLLPEPGCALDEAVSRTSAASRAQSGRRRTWSKG
jgi:hypothetical protein